MAFRTLFKQQDLQSHINEKAICSPCALMLVLSGGQSWKEGALVCYGLASIGNCTTRQQPLPLQIIKCYIDALVCSEGPSCTLSLTLAIPTNSAIVWPFRSEWDTLVWMGLRCVSLIDDTATWKGEHFTDASFLEGLLPSFSSEVKGFPLISPSIIVSFHCCQSSRIILIFRVSGHLLLPLFFPQAELIVRFQSLLLHRVRNG